MAAFCVIAASSFCTTLSSLPLGLSPSHPVSLSPSLLSSLSLSLQVQCCCRKKRLNGCESQCETPPPAPSLLHHFSPHGWLKIGHCELISKKKKKKPLPSHTQYAAVHRWRQHKYNVFSAWQQNAGIQQQGIQLQTDTFAIQHSNVVAYRSPVIPKNSSVTEWMTYWHLHPVVQIK